MDEGKDERTDSSVYVRPFDVATSTVKIQIPQLSADISVTTKAGEFRFTPTSEITAYQLALVMRLCFACANMRGWLSIDDAFAEVYAETAEQWEKVE